MTTKKITELDEESVPLDATDLAVVVSDVPTTPTTKKATLGTLRRFMLGIATVGTVVLPEAVVIGGALAVNANVALGASTANTLVFNARVASHVDPAAPATYDIGALALTFRHAYFSGTVTAAAFAGNASTVTNGVYTSGSYGDPLWLTSLAWSKLTGVPSTFTPSAHTHPWSAITSTPTTVGGYGITDFNALGDARWVLLTGSYANPGWITALAWSKISGTPTSLAAYGILDGVANTRALTVAGATGRITSSAGAQSLAADRTWTLDLAMSGVAPGGYGGATTSAQLTVDSYGRITAAANVGITVDGSAITGTVPVARGGTNIGTLTALGYLRANALATAYEWRTAAQIVADGGGASAVHTHPFSDITALPNSLAGYGVNDAVFKSSSATDNALVRFDSTSGNYIQNSGLLLDDSNVLTWSGDTNLYRSAANVLRTDDTFSAPILLDSGYRAMSATAMDVPRNIGAVTNLSTDLESGGAYWSYGAGGTSWNAPFSYGGVVAFAGTSGIRAQLGFDIRHGSTDYSNLWFRTKNNLGYTGWATMLHTANYSSYALPLTGGTVTGNVGVGISPVTRFHVNDGSARNFLVTSDASQQGTSGIAIGSFTDNAGAYAPLSIVSSFTRFNSFVGINASGAYIDANDKFVVAGGRLAVNAGAYDAAAFGRFGTGTITNYLSGGFGRGYTTFDGASFGIGSYTDLLLLAWGAVRFSSSTGGPYISGVNQNTLNAAYGLNTDTGDMWINYRGYLDGFTRFRDFRIGDGKGNTIATFVGASRNVTFNQAITADIIYSSSSVQATHIGVNPSGASNTGQGISLYGGPQINPSYGLFFQGTLTYGTHGAVTADWATYFTMDVTANRGWIFRNMGNSTNVASINNAGTAVFNGTVTASNWILGSDLRQKEHVTEIRSAMDEVRATPGLHYWHSVHRRWELGFGAQHLEQGTMLSLAVHHNADGYLGVYYDRTIPVLWQAVREQDTEVTTLKRQVAQLQDAVRALGGTVVS